MLNSIYRNQPTVRQPPTLGVNGRRGAEASGGWGMVGVPHQGPHGLDAAAMYSEPGASANGFPILTNRTPGATTPGAITGQTGRTPLGSRANAGGADPGTPTERSGGTPNPNAVQGQTGRTPLGSRNQLGAPKLAPKDPFTGKPPAPTGTGGDTTSGGGGDVPVAGTESGPGILESWFNQRATGTDPAYEYSIKRGMDSLADRYAASGGFNSGAARQGEADFLANAQAQRMGQLDALAGGASGEHQGRLNSMLDNFYRLSSGRAGIGGIYDTGAASAMSNADMAAILMALNKAGVDSQSNQAGLRNLIGLGSLIYGA